MQFTATFAKLVALLASSAALVGAQNNPDTPRFQFVSSSTLSAYNLQPLKLANGANSGPATISGPGPVLQFEFYGGKLVTAPTSELPNRLTPFIQAAPFGGRCGRSGPVILLQNPAPNSCALTNRFDIQSDDRNAQLGAHLTFNFIGGFYACGPNRFIFYLAEPGDAPRGLTCIALDLDTVPVRRT